MTLRQSCSGVVIPVILGTVGFAWWFRESNQKARYRAEWTYSGRVELVIWSVPTLVVIFLAGITWLGTHQLDPFKPIASYRKPINVQAISLDWKWLFVYPDEGVATINHLVVPIDRPVHLSITSASVMNSLLIPRLGSQIYAMAGMVTQLNLKIQHAGTYRGLSAQFSGEGFSDTVFDVQSLSPDLYKNWASKARAVATYWTRRPTKIFQGNGCPFWFLAISSQRYHRVCWALRGLRGSIYIDCGWTSRA
ncbi:cytochrome ubiquinol oxidase subunit II [Rhizobium sp. P38BS-XIX]|uniref:cytochrome ubiquinol oxidase subunit II n=1 Tax=Rhizobium sp. P38BS-XIX TaxID=2726740 RepID=UPI0014575E1C|nr:cytochrome ubiquinol oxidase subunit II [Rhizobium sp. P38BS-XIX]NLR97235.1 cytochrome ubiquinol oxidase subunit II [Rhizobium sp. P38BS-XIX]